jgi:hypothetical protein
VLSMPILTCPRCANSGEIRGDDGSFEDVWPMARGHFPVRKCRECGAAIIVSPKFLICGTRATLIPDDTWRRMEETLAGGAPTVDKPLVCEECGLDFTSASALEEHAGRPRRWRRRSFSH